MTTATRSIDADLTGLREAIAQVAARTDIKNAARIADNLTRTLEYMQEIEYLVPGLYNYSGRNEFLLSVLKQVRNGKPLSDKQIETSRAALAREPKSVEDYVAGVLDVREGNAMAVIANSGRVRELAERQRDMAHSDPEYVLAVATNVTVGKCPDGCCGGPEVHETRLAWVQELELLAASLIQEDAA